MRRKRFRAELRCDLTGVRHDRVIEWVVFQEAAKRSGVFVAAAANRRIIPL
jgi:hypothetical protein